jgi:hypothetical protein
MLIDRLLPYRCTTVCFKDAAATPSYMLITFPLVSRTYRAVAPPLICLRIRLPAAFSILEINSSPSFLCPPRVGQHARTVGQHHRNIQLTISDSLCLIRFTVLIFLAVDKYPYFQPALISQPCTVELQNHELNEQLMLISQLDEDEKNALVKIINSMLTKKRMKDLPDGKVKL